ncbi:MAG: CHC2 zinc finger domain-containing protein [Planctomycetota bacterium]|nr:CHC2 zinc finger domain-containing protein [Planctomycetota bacterium]
MSGIDYRHLRSMIPMERVLQLLQFRVTWRRGTKVRSFCPIHDRTGEGDHRCFSVDLERNVFQCFRCGAKGNQLDLWRLAHKVSLYRAALLLCEHAGVRPPKIGEPAPCRTLDSRNSSTQSARPATE